MKKCRILFSFDDARLDTYEAVMLAKQYGIKSTINITTEYVANTISEFDQPSVLPAMSKQQVIALKEDEYIELACHSANHKNTFEDILLGKKQLIEWIGDNGDSIGFASPNSKIDFHENSLDKFKDSKFKYVRVGHVKSKQEKAYRIARKLSRIARLKRLLCYTYKNTLRNTVEDNYLVHGIPVLNDNTVSQFKYMVKYAVKNGYDCLFIFHSVLNQNEPMGKDTWTWDRKKYIEFCEFLKQENEKGVLEFSLTKDLIKS